VTTDCRNDEIVRIDLDDETDRLAFRCPAGHAQWEPTNKHFYCRTCAAQAQRGADVEPSFDQLRDERSGELIPRERIRLVSEFGDWRDIRGGRSA
jgi:hypothetical protein